MTSPTCRGVRADGSPCTIKSGLSPEGYCIWHDPARRDVAAEMRARGGRTQGRKGIRTVDAEDTPGPLESMADAVRWASWAARAVAVGSLDSRTAHEIGVLLREFRSGVEKAQLENRVKELERALKEATS